MNHISIKEKIPTILLMVLIAYVAYINIAYMEPLISMPSPIYGGDLYYQMGDIHHFMQGGGFMESSSLYNALPTYLPGYAYPVSMVANGFDISAFEAMKYSSLFFTILSLLLWFLLLKKIFKDN